MATCSKDCPLNLDKNTFKFSKIWRFQILRFFNFSFYGCCVISKFAFFYKIKVFLHWYYEITSSSYIIFISLNIFQSALKRSILPKSKHISKRVETIQNYIFSPNPFRAEIWQTLSSVFIWNDNSSWYQMFSVPTFPSYLDIVLSKRTFGIKNILSLREARAFVKGRHAKIGFVCLAQW